MTRSLLMTCGLVSVLALGACDAIVYSGPTATTSSQPELYNAQFATEAQTGSLNDNQITGLSRHYWSNGNGPFIINVTFDPHSKTNTAQKAATEAAKLAAAFKAKGIQTVQSGTVAVPESGPQSRTMISYDTLNAKASENCPEAMNMKFAELGYAPDYKLGCSVEIYTSRQVARPADLTGNNVMDNNSGRRDANLLQTYQSGEAYPDLKGANASQSSK